MGVDPVTIAAAVAAAAAVASAGVAVGTSISQKKKKTSQFPFSVPDPITAATKKPQVRAPSRLALISTSTQGVLNEAPVGRRKILGN